jgi:hypothetical protein
LLTRSRKMENIDTCFTIATVAVPSRRRPPIVAGERDPFDRPPGMGGSSAQLTYSELASRTFDLAQAQTLSRTADEPANDSPPCQALRGDTAPAGIILVMKTRRAGWISVIKKNRTRVIAPSSILLSLIRCLFRFMRSRVPKKPMRSEIWALITSESW